MNPAPPVTSRRIRGRLAVHFGEAGAQAFAPVRKHGSSRPLAAQHGVRRPRGGTLELSGRDPTDAAPQAGLLEDRLGELGPGAIATGCDVPQTLGPIVVHELPDRSSQMPGVGRAAPLVVDDRHLVALV